MSIIRDPEEFLRSLARKKRTRGWQPRKMTDITVEEVSGVDSPAHLHPGWLVRKAAAQHAHGIQGAHYIDPADEGVVPDLKPGETVEMGPGRTLGRDDCNCLYMLTPETTLRAEQEAFEAAYRERFGKEAAPKWSPADIRFLLGEK